MKDEVRFLFYELADLSPGDRERVLEQRQVDPEIRREVESLLRFDGLEADSLTGCVPGVVGEMLRTADRAVGYCGPYRLVRLLGRGGMGSVYLAERNDGEIQQTAAIKLLRTDAQRPGWYARFLKERQVLASLNHPSIVHVLDAGHTEQHQPYLVMEFVEGRPIDEYAEGIAVRDKLALFVRVCDGVSHAHRHLIIHRDLKPSNILVDASGQPKLLDFGIAKLLDEAGDPTRTGERFLTPVYASPEHIRGAVQTTASDIYSLGAVLYKLLAGQPPHEWDSLAAEIVPASRLNPAVPADLDYILAKALRSEPEQRYASVEAFAADITAFLDSRPLEVRSGSAWYRTRKFLRRNWIPVTALALVIASLATGLYVANRERAIAQARFRELRRLAHTFVFDLHDEIAKLQGSTKTREMMVRTALEYLDSLAKGAGGDLDIQREIAEAYTKIGDAQGYPTKPNLGRMADALASYRKAGDIYRRIAAQNPGYQPDLARYYLRFAGLVRFTNEPEQARALVESAIQTFDRVRNQKSAGVKLQTSYIRAWCTLGDLDEDMERTRQAYSEFSQCATLARDELRKTKDRAALSAISEATERVATAAADLGLFSEALGALEEDESVLSQLLAATPHDPVLRRRQALVYHYRAEIYYDERYPNLGDPASALQYARRYLELAREMVRNDPNDTSARFSTAVALFQVSALVRESDANAAIRLARESVKTLDELASGNPSFLNDSRRLLALQHLAEAQLKAGRIGEARRSAEAALEGQRSIAGRNPKDVDAHLKLVPMLILDGEIHAASGDFRGAESCLVQAQDQAQGLAASRSADSLIALGRAEEALGKFFSGRRRRVEARRCIERLAALWQQFPQANQYVERQRAAAARLASPALCCTITKRR